MGKMKPETVQRKVRRLEEAMDRMEHGLYPGLSISEINDQIAWLWKFRYIDYYDMSRLAHRSWCISQLLV